MGKTSGPVLSRLWTKVHEILQQRRRPFALSNALAWLSVSCFVQQIFAIKCRSRRKTEQVQKFFGPQYFREGRPQLFYGTLLERPTDHRLTKVAEFRLLISVCEARQWSGMRNLHRVGKNAGRVWSCLWTKVHDILGQWRRHLVVVNALDRLSIPCFIPKIWAVKVAVELRSRPKKVGFGPPICRGRGYLRFRTCVCKLHLLPTMWPIFVQFRSAISEIRRRKKRRKKERKKHG